MLSERESKRCQIKSKRLRRAIQGTIIEPLRGIFRTCLNVKPAPRPLCGGVGAGVGLLHRRTFSLSQMNNVELARTLSWRENALLRNEKRTFLLSQMNNVELARALSWRENALFEERKKKFYFPSSGALSIRSINWSSFGVMMICVRRLRCLPTSVPLVATGLNSPRPPAVRRLGLTP